MVDADSDGAENISIGTIINHIETKVRDAKLAKQ